MSASAPPTHISETIADRKKSRELAEARQAGTAAPEVDVKTGAMINPHNPEFITRRPWYLGGNDAGPSLDHQADQRATEDRVELSLTSADRLVRAERERLKKQISRNQVEVGMWVEALKRNKKPYTICQIVKISKKGTEFDLKYEDGTIEKKVKWRRDGRKDGRIRLTKAGARSFAVDHKQFGKETYDSKRDAYHGFDVNKEFMARMEEKYSKRDAMRRQYRSKDETDKKAEAGDEDKNKDEKEERHSDSDSDYDSDANSDDDDEFVQRDEDATTFQSRIARQGGVGGNEMKLTTRNLRIREDTAKYLRNLDLNSAYYDPKSRAMRDNPNPEVAPEESQFAGENFARVSGDAVEFAKTQLFAWEAQEKVAAVTVDDAAADALHPQANPSQTELLRKQFKSKSKDYNVLKKKALLDKYGGSEYIDGGDGKGGTSFMPESGSGGTSGETLQQRRVRMSVQTTAQHYTPDGRIATSNTSNTTPNIPLKSKYEENIFLYGHTSVWGSYFHKGAFTWGYADDHSLMKNSYCTGSSGRDANDKANEMRYGTGRSGSAALAQAREMLKVLPSEKRQQAPPSASTAALYGEADAGNTASLDPKKLQDAIAHTKKTLSAQSEKDDDDRKRKYNSLKSNDQDVTQEDMEAYRMLKRRSDDPMANLGEGQILDYK